MPRRNVPGSSFKVKVPSMYAELPSATMATHVPSKLMSSVSTRLDDSWRKQNV